MKTSTKPRDLNCRLIPNCTNAALPGGAPGGHQSELIVEPMDSHNLSMSRTVGARLNGRTTGQVGTMKMSEVVAAMGKAGWTGTKKAAK